MKTITKKISIVFLTILLIELSYGQIPQKYSELTAEALKLYENKEYQKSGQKYSEAFNLSSEHVIITDRFLAARSWALSNNRDSAFSQLFKLVKKSNFIFEDYVTTNPDLNVLHSDIRWNQIIEMINNKENDELILDKALGDTFNAIYFKDMKYRRKVKEIEKKFGFQSDTLKVYWKKIAENDSITLTKVINILDTRGWLGSDIIGVLGNRTLFLTIQHSDLKTQEKYLPMMKEAVQKGNASPGNFAYYVDRVALRQGKKQFYGSQLFRDQVTGEYFISPLEDPDNVDMRRTEVGLGKLQDYISDKGMIWNAEQYKKRLPDIEAEYKKVNN